MKERGSALFRASWPALVITLFVALPWLWNPMVLDDWHNLWNAAQSSWRLSDLASHFTFLDHHAISSWPLPVLPPYKFFRPLVVLSLKLDMMVWGLSGWGSHLTNLGFHLISTLLVVALAYRLSKNLQIARIAGLLFGIQPQNVSAVIWTSGRTELIVATWMLAGMLCYVIARQDKRQFFLWLTLLFQGLACFSKESAVLLPMCIFAYEITIERGKAGAFSSWMGQAFFRMLPVGLLISAYLIFRFFFFDSGPLPGHPYVHSLHEPGFLTFIVAKLSYYLLALLLTALVTPMFGTHFLTSHPWVLLLLVVSTGWIYWILVKETRRQGIAQVAWLWLGAAFLPTLPVMAIDLYLYFGSVGFAMALATFFAGRLPSASPAASSLWWKRLLIAYVLFYGAGFSGRGALYHIYGSVSQRTYEDIMAETGGRLEKGTVLHLVNMPFAASHIAPMLRLKTNNPDITALLISISTNWIVPEKKASVLCLGPGKIQVRPPASQESFFTTLEEKNLQLLQREFDPHHSYSSPWATVTPVVEEESVSALDVTFPRPPDQGLDQVYLFYDDGERLAHRVCEP